MAEKRTAQERALEVRFERPANAFTAAKAFLKGVAKEYGAETTGISMRPRHYVKSSSMKFNRIMGGGWLRGRIYEQFGPESGGKTAWALDAVANAQRQYPNLQTLYFDAEATLDLDRAAAIGVDVKAMPKPIIPPNGDAAMDMMYKACMSGGFSTLVLDSIAILMPSEEVVSDIAESRNRVGLAGKMMSAAMRKLVKAAYDSETLLIFINQVRDKIGDNAYSAGPKEETPGGRAVKFAASARISVKALGGKDNVFLGPGGERIGHRIEMQVVKNKLGAPYRKAEMDLFYAAPLDTVSEVFSLGMDTGVITFKGRSYHYGKVALGNSKEEVKEKLFSDFDLKMALMNDVEAIYVKPDDITASKEEETKALLEGLDVPDVVPEKVLEGEPL